MASRSAPAGLKDQEDLVTELVKSALPPFSLPGR